MGEQQMVVVETVEAPSQEAVFAEMGMKLMNGNPSADALAVVRGQLEAWYEGAVEAQNGALVNAIQVMWDKTEVLAEQNRLMTEFGKLAMTVATELKTQRDGALATINELVEAVEGEDVDHPLVGEAIRKIQEDSSNDGYQAGYEVGAEEEGDFAEESAYERVAEMVRDNVQGVVRDGGNYMLHRTTKAYQQANDFVHRLINDNFSDGQKNALKAFLLTWEMVETETPAPQAAVSAWMGSYDVPFGDDDDEGEVSDD